jgi:uncharacterized protein YjbI with pentapeptide repeats
MNADQSTIPKPKFVPSRVRLWILLSLLLLLSPYAAVNVWALGKFLRARYAASRIENLGGHVTFLPNARYEGLRAGDWYKPLIGDSITTVSFSGAKISDADLGLLDRFSKVYGLYLDHTAITSAGLEVVKTRTELRFLSLRGTGTSDAGLKELQGLVNLQKLNLRGTKVTDAGLKELEGLPSLHELNLGDTKVTSAGVQHIEKIANLFLIDLEGTRVSTDLRERLNKLCASRNGPDDD